MGVSVAGDLTPRIRNAQACAQVDEGEGLRDNDHTQKQFGHANHISPVARVPGRAAYSLPAAQLERCAASCDASRAASCGTHNLATKHPMCTEYFVR
jgi:hypothetical protein